MNVRIKILTRYRTSNSTIDNIDIPFLQEILDNQLEIESLSTLNSNPNDQFFILIGSTSKKLQNLRTDIELAFKNKGAYVELEFLEIKMSKMDSNPSKRV